MKGSIYIDVPCDQKECTLNIVDAHDQPIDFDPTFCSTCNMNPNVEDGIPKVIMDLSGLCAFLQKARYRYAKVISTTNHSFLDNIFPWRKSALKTTETIAEARSACLFIETLMHKCGWAAPNDPPIPWWATED